MTTNEANGTFSDFNRICRTCLTIDVEFLPIFTQKQSNLSSNTGIITKLTDVASIEVSVT